MSTFICCVSDVEEGPGRGHFSLSAAFWCVWLLAVTELVLSRMWCGGGCGAFTLSAARRRSSGSFDTVAVVLLLVLFSRSCCCFSACPLARPRSSSNVHGTPFTTIFEPLIYAFDCAELLHLYSVSEAFYYRGPLC
jgi:hypothetical protein